MELDTVIKKRRSIRIFQDQPVEKKVIKLLIDAAIHAPSACNIQGWKFIVVDDIKIKNKLVDFGGAQTIKKAPLGILVLYDNRSKEIERMDYIQSAAAAIQNLLLKATELGLGSCWICHLPTNKNLRKIFKVPDHFSPIAYILLGYPQQAAKEVARKYSLDQIMNYNQFSADWPSHKINKFNLMLNKILVKIYYLAPNLLKKRLLNKILDKKFVKKFDN